MRSALRRIFVRGAVHAFRIAYQPRLAMFERALKDPKLAQSKVLDNILSQMESTEFGRRHGVYKGMSRDEFRARVPISNYESLEPWIQHQARSLAPVITPAPLKIFEKTSGSRGAAKWIPYNKSQLDAFERMFVLWSLDLFRSGLNLLSGRVFFLISPKLVLGEMAPNGIPVGLQDDTGYLGSMISAFSRFFFIDSSRNLTTPENFLFDLSLSLLREPELEVISVWSPSLLLLVAQVISQERTKFAHLEGLCEATRDALESSDCDRHLHARLWPKLQLISAWDAATARDDAAKVRDIFEHARFQGKGLLATEAAMTVPWTSAGAQVPLVTDVFFEFEDERDGSIRELHQLEVGETYVVLVTTANGFLRYKIGDRVRAGRVYHATPTLEFVGRAGGTSDFRGEKLSHEFVESCLDSLFPDGRPFSLVVPRFENGDLCYHLLIDDSSIELGALSGRFEEVLVTSHHYALARKLGQLQRARAIWVPNLREFYFESRTDRGAQAGQIKIEVLLTDPQFSSDLDGAMRRLTTAGRRSRSESAARL